MKFVSGMEFESNGWNKVLKRWKKNGMDRVYINNSNGKTCGYVDLIGKTSSSNGTYGNMDGWNEYCEAILNLEF